MLEQGPMEAASHTAAWDLRDEHGRRAASGVYFVVLKPDNIRQMRKILLLN